MAINDLYQITVVQKQTATGEKFSNVFTFRAVDATCSAAGLVEAMTNTGSVVDKMLAWQATAVSCDSLRVINLFSLTDFYEGSLVGSGLGAGEMLPAHNAVGYTLKLNTRGVSPGSKRFVGLSELAQVAGIITDATVLTALEALRVKLAQTITGDVSDNYEPVVVKRILMEPDEDHPAPWYRLPANVGEANWGKVVSAVLNVRVRHQISRGNLR